MLKCMTDAARASTAKLTRIFDQSGIRYADADFIYDRLSMKVFDSEAAAWVEKVCASGFADVTVRERLKRQEEQPYLRYFLINARVPTT